MVALTRVPPTRTARHRCFSQLRTPVAAVQDQLQRRLSRRRFYAFSWSMGPGEPTSSPISRLSGPKQCSPNGGWRVTRLESLLRGGTSREEGDGVDLDLRVQQQAGDLHGGARGRVFRKELSADA